MAFCTLQELAALAATGTVQCITEQLEVYEHMLHCSVSHSVAYDEEAAGKSALLVIDGSMADFAICGRCDRLWQQDRTAVGSIGLLS